MTTSSASYPSLRMRRLRRHDWTRALVAEARLSASDFIWPLFVIDGNNRREPVASMPGVERLSVDLAAKAAEEAATLGIPVIALSANALSADIAGALEKGFRRYLTKPARLNEILDTIAQLDKTRIQKPVAPQI